MLPSTGHCGNWGPRRPQPPHRSSGGVYYFMLNYRRVWSSKGASHLRERCVKRTPTRLIKYVLCTESCCCHRDSSRDKPQHRPRYEPQHLVFFSGGEQRPGVGFTALSTLSFSNANSGWQKNGKQLSSSALRESLKSPESRGWGEMSSAYCRDVIIVKAK